MNWKVKTAEESKNNVDAAALDQSIGIAIAIGLNPIRFDATQLTYSVALPQCYKF